MPTLDLEKWGLTGGVGEEHLAKPSPPLPDIDWAQRIRPRLEDDYVIDSLLASTNETMKAMRLAIQQFSASPLGISQAYQPIYWYPYDELQRIFGDLRNAWKTETSMSSSTQDISMHPAYQRIIGLGRQAIPLLLRELQTDPDQWFWALEATSRENPADVDDDFDTRAQKWVNWGRESGYLTSA